VKPIFPWAEVIFLIIVAVIWASPFGKPLLVIACVIMLPVAWAWFARRFPLTAVCIAGFVRGLCGGGRGRW
jgi:hypothetical protein